MVSYYVKQAVVKNKEKDISAPHTTTTNGASVHTLIARWCLSDIDIFHEDTNDHCSHLACVCVCHLISKLLMMWLMKKNHNKDGQGHLKLCTHRRQQTLEWNIRAFMLAVVQAISSTFRLGLRLRWLRLFPSRSGTIMVSLEFLWKPDPSTPHHIRVTMAPSTRVFGSRKRTDFFGCSPMVQLTCKRESKSEACASDERKNPI